MKLKNFFRLGEIFSYFIRVFRKPDPNKPNNFNIRVMHGINRISIIMFLLALIIIITRFVVRSF